MGEQVPNIQEYVVGNVEAPESEHINRIWNELIESIVNENRFENFTNTTNITIFILTNYLGYQ